MTSARRRESGGEVSEAAPEPTAMTPAAVYLARSLVMAYAAALLFLCVGFALIVGVSDALWATR